ncbi:hypothetical protein V500_01738 [Pseudogymnoascus sp. VKM F-4518 (FW-2643)]|nr:hypothetical protein V500_01738 [Pseudogymnoascus sp. VKM F-4518 (FW-2643)]
MKRLKGQLRMARPRIITGHKRTFVTVKMQLTNDYISAKNDYMDTIELSPGLKRSDDQDGSTNGTDGEDHANNSSGSNIEHPQRLKRRRAKSTDSSAQTNFSNVKDVTLATDSWDVLS